VFATVNNFDPLILNRRNVVHYDELPIFKSALDFVIYIEQIVKNFDK